MKAQHPMQPIELDSLGTPRFKQNKIISFIIENGSISLNDIAILAANNSSFTNADQRQLAQLIGYSTSAYCGLPYAENDDSAKIADEKSRQLLRDLKQND